MSKRKNILWTGALLAVLWIACDRQTLQETEQIPLPATENTSLEDQNEILIDLIQLDGNLRPDTVNVEVRFDKAFKTAKRFLALPLQPILESLIAQYELDTATTEVFFICKDGYIPSNSIPEIFKAGGGYLAFKDLDETGSALWPDSLAEKYAPYYLVWENVPYEDKTLAWPWGLTSIRLVENDPGLQSLYPTEAPDLANAFELFRQNCLKCHSINKIGGVMGPEMNYPKNITEYWTRENIVAFAQNPTSFRYNSKMAPITYLKEEELHRIVDYLEYMAEHKLEEREN